MKKRLIAAGLMLAMFTGSAYAVSSYQKTINVEYGVSLSINGQTPTLTDVNGKTVQPFVYDGTTYVPIRAVGEGFGITVNYDNQNNIASLYGKSTTESKNNFDVAALSHRIHELSLTSTLYIADKSVSTDTISSVMDSYEVIKANADSLKLSELTNRKTLDDARSALNDQLIALQKMITHFFNYKTNSSPSELSNFYSAAKDEGKYFESVQVNCDIINAAP